MKHAPAGFELRDHTADIALYVWGDSRGALFRAAADGLYATIGELVVRGESRTESLRLEAGDIESLLQDFLSELLFRFETKAVRISDFAFRRLDDTVLDAAMRVAEVDQRASLFDREVKAVTYHDLNVIERDGRYEVTLILDI